MSARQLILNRPPQRTGRAGNSGQASGRKPRCRQYSIIR